MKTFKDWGIKIRRDIPRNYYAIWDQLKTTRLDLGEEVKLPWGEAEFYDVAITTRCNAECPFCYVSAGHGGCDFRGPSEVWKAWIDSLPADEPIDLEGDTIFRDIIAPPREYEKLGSTEVALKLEVLQALRESRPIVYTYKPFQTALGSTGEPTIHPEFPQLLETIYQSGVVPNYTTNGVYLSPEVLEATRAYVGGVAVSYGNKALRSSANSTIETLLRKGDCKVMIHHLISDPQSVDDFLEAVGKWGQDIHYHVLLPLKAHGRSREEMTEEAFLYLVRKVKEEEITNIALGMWFLPWLEKYPRSFNVYEYPAETYSANMLLGDERIVITPSSYNLTPTWTWQKS